MSTTLQDIESGAPATAEAPLQPKVTVQPKAPALPAWLTARVPDGEEVDKYLTHPLNITKSRGLAQALRGFTAMFGSLNFAVVDIVVGLFSFTRERPAGVNRDGAEPRAVIPQ